MTVTILQGDCRAVLPTLESGSVQMCVTSPPYYHLRDYGIAGQIGLEETPDMYIASLVAVFREVRRVLRDDGTLWVNIGDSYVNNPSTTTIPRAEQGNGQGLLRLADQKHQDARRQKANWAQPLVAAGLKMKDLIGVPWMLAFALRADGWWLRSDIIWSKPNCMPESVTDRVTRSHEYLFLLSKNERYFYDADAIKEPAVNGDLTPPRGSEGVVTPPNTGRRKQDEVGSRTYTGFNARWDAREPLTMRNKRSVWTIATTPYAGAHFATFPEKLIEPCILAGSRPGDIVLDPFFGSGTTGRVAIKHGRSCWGIELNPAYIDQAEARTDGVQIALASA